jgi:hypothetical protein
MSKRALWLLAALALSASCQFREMMALREQIAAQFHESHVQVNVINKGTVVVSFINSPLNTASADEKQKRADEVAAFVLANLKHPVPQVRVFFVAQSEAGTVTKLDRYTGR